MWAQMHLANDKAQQMREGTLDAIWGLVESMHYGKGHERWGAHIDSIEGADVHRAVRSEQSFDAMATGLVGALGDPCASTPAAPFVDL